MTRLSTGGYCSSYKNIGRPVTVLRLVSLYIWIWVDDDIVK